MKYSTLINAVFCFSLMACQSPKTAKTIDSEAIRINQIGYYSASVKQFVVADYIASSFDVIDTTNKVIFSGELKDNGTWETSGEKVLMGDFSELKTAGIYRILLNDGTASYKFEIKPDVYKDALNASIKSFYLQRSTMLIEEKYAGIYQRAAGHPDNKCPYHPSSGKSNGTLNSPGGWYDAGDYGKYIVNASISVGQMLLFVEQFPNAIEDGELNIPESGNGISDLWDELKYELDWMLTMQDVDGGVYHKLTTKAFCGFVMPEKDTLDRYVIGKGTAATADFAAVMAQASRLYKNIDPGWSATTLEAAKKAWAWAVVNNNIPYSNPTDVSTGAYDDKELNDELYWAAAELFISTKDEVYMKYLNENPQAYQLQLTNSWKFFIRNNAFHSLLQNKSMLNETFAGSLLKGHIDLANDLLKKIEENPYRIALELYEWGSNSDVLNQAMILCMAHKLSGEEKYLKGAEQLTDYIFGKNATAYSFLTGFGSKQSMFPHHRPSGADGIEQPVPGFIIGGPNKDKQDKQQVTYTSDFPAKSYVDAEASYATNEVCINWNAPAVYVLGYLQQVRE
jgi:endoglucanase